MKSSLLSLLAALLFLLSGYSQKVYYAASKSGLNMREKADPASTVLTKIPYGEKVTLIELDYSTDLKTEGMEAYWMKISYGGKTGYVANVYALPFPPPIIGGDVQGYAKQLGKATASWSEGPDFATDTSITDADMRLEKTFYNNGIIYRSIHGYEWFAETIWIPHMNMQQAFVLARLLCSSPQLLNTNDAFPNRSIKSSETSPKDIRILSYFENNVYPEMIHIEICDGGCEYVDIKNEDGEISITFGSGV